MASLPPLDGFIPKYRVLDLADEKGDYCTKLLADLGADVVKVEPPGGEKGRHRGPFWKDQVHPEKSLYFLYYNTSKRSITLNLEHPDGQAMCRELVRRADVVMESSAPGYLKGLGLGYDDLSALNPRLVVAAITPFGQTGPYKDFKGSDLIVMAMSGYMQVTGDPDGPPVRLGNEQSHFAPSQYAAIGILAALYHRDLVSGKGQFVDISMQETIITYYLEQHPAMMWQLLKQNVARVGPISEVAVPGGAFPAQDGLVAIGVVTPREWDSLAQWIAEVTGNQAALDPKYKGGIHARRPYRDEIIALMMDFTTRLTVNEFYHEGQKRGLAAVPVATVKELVADPHLVQSGFWVELDHPVVGKLQYAYGGITGTEIPPPRWAAPLLGQDNEAIYTGELGLTASELAALKAAGVI